jgi:hypothetical protein
MILNAARTIAISNMGWVDGGRLWCFKVGDSKASEVPLSNSAALTLVGGANDHFAVIHHEGDERVRLTAHSFQNIPDVVSSIELSLEGRGADPSSPAPAAKIKGDLSAWSLLPAVYSLPSLPVPFLLSIDRAQGVGRLDALTWYEGAYDAMYQAILDIVVVPNSSLVIIPIQRDSEPVIYDHAQRRVVRKIKLAGRRGNPQLSLCRKAPELWASDYDSLVRVSTDSWEVLGIKKLQDGNSEMDKLFIGKFDFSLEEDICAVSRPFSGDIVGLDTKRFAITHRAETGSQPEDVGLLRENQVIARDWKTGTLLRGTLKKV